MRQYLTVAACMTVLLCMATVADNCWSSEQGENQPTASISIGAEFSSGSYNSSTTTRAAYLPLIISWYPSERLDMSMELPFVYQSNSQITTSLYQNGVASSSQTVARYGGPGGVYSTTSNSTTTNNNRAVSGLGDIILRAGYIPWFEKGGIPQLRASLYVKTPTASASDGLGTGEFDYGGGIDLSKWYGDFHLAAETTYTWQGKVSGFGLKNYLSYNATSGYQLTQNLQPMLMVKGASAPSTASDNLLEVRARLLWNLTTRTMLDGFVSRGLSDSSPDYTTGLAMIYYF